MSKKHKKRHHYQAQPQHQPQQPAQQPTTSSVTNLPEVRQETRDLKTDLWHLLAVNVFLLAVLLALFYTNQSSQYLNHWLDKFIHI